MSKRIGCLLVGGIMLVITLTACQAQQSSALPSQPTASQSLIPPTLTLPDQAAPTQYALNKSEPTQPVAVVHQASPLTTETQTPEQPTQAVTPFPTPIAILAGDLPTSKNHQGALKP